MRDWSNVYSLEQTGKTGGWQIFTLSPLDEYSLPKGWSPFLAMIMMFPCGGHLGVNKVALRAKTCAWTIFMYDSTKENIDKKNF
ncbi:hypothetical protein Csa_016667 [Cucumis sativus]|uniref:Uncharacterized protein n=1 Tax=Cucumis sativus TaxID=3659 RepID=A0A0A0KBG7_CUCSA|nr:hypothetical protein Csa_016667 [Cucumis sativus]